MYRLLSIAGENRERRRQRTHPARKKPELIARAPNQVWSWDITKLPGPERGVYYELFVIIDIYSRYVVAWTVAEAETGELAEAFIADALDSGKHGDRRLAPQPLGCGTPAQRQGLHTGKKVRPLGDHLRVEGDSLRLAAPALGHFAPAEPHAAIVAPAQAQADRVHGLAAVEAGLAVGRLGRSSVTYLIGLFRPGATEAAADPAARVTASGSSRSVGSRTYLP